MAFCSVVSLDAQICSYFRGHITGGKCEICQSKGSICEARWFILLLPAKLAMTQFATCVDKKPIYPFQLDVVVRALFL